MTHGRTPGPFFFFFFFFFFFTESTVTSNIVSRLVVK